ncbi:glycosyltransferase family 39 protein [Demequina sp. NBRC 110056]|uniref:glycosyltransferase family 39 protein n=1 Tax=Demequina sp. NBRC 110056 TaxID=1570345 RepID=UPI00118088DE|nr:glycosyltransferase family 39 protein [Demequina sp. NBRC 110056]
MTDLAHHAPGAAPPTRLGPLARALAAAPERTVLIVAATAIAAGLAVTVGAHVWWVVLPLAAAVIVLCWRPLAPEGPATAADARAGAIAMGGAAVWTVVNMILGAEYLLVVRDPGFLSLSGMWLVDHASTDIPALGADLAAQAGTQTIPDASEAWNLKGDVIQPQGAKMLPATIAIGGWIAGDAGVLAANVVIGAAGLLAVYAVARRFLSPLAALAPAGCLALTVAHIGLSRPAYTEPLTLLLAIAAVLWAWRGVERRSAGLLAAAGATSGATMLVRIDGTAFAIGACAGVLLALLLSDAWPRRRLALGASFVAAQVLLAVIGYVSVAVWSTEYLARLEGRSTLLNAVYLLAAAGALVLLALAAWSPLRSRLRLARVWLRTSPGGLLVARATGAAVALVLVALAARPLWTVARRGTDTESAVFANGVVESFQAAQGLEIDGQRTYAESTVSWLSYHLTWVVVVLAVVGFAIAASRMVRTRPGWAVMLGACLAPTLLYLVYPSIIPDQIWAIRRFEPATLPGLVLAAALAVWTLAALPRSDRARLVARRIGAAVLVLAPVTTWLALTPDRDIPVSSAVNVTTREMVGARAMLDDLCALAPGRPIILVGTSEVFGSLRVTCDVPVVLALADQDAKDLAAMAQSFDTAPVVLTRDPDGAPWTTDPGRAVESTVRHSAYTLEGLPRSVYERSYRWIAGIVTDDGTVEPIA